MMHNIAYGRTMDDDQQQQQHQQQIQISPQPPALPHSPLTLTPELLVFLQSLSLLPPPPLEAAITQSAGGGGPGVVGVGTHQAAMATSSARRSPHHQQPQHPTGGVFRSSPSPVFAATTFPHPLGGQLLPQQASSHLNQQLGGGGTSSMTTQCFLPLRQAQQQQHQLEGQRQPPVLQHSSLDHRQQPQRTKLLVAQNHPQPPPELAAREQQFVHHPNQRHQQSTTTTTSAATARAETFALFKKRLAAAVLCSSSTKTKSPPLSVVVVSLPPPPIDPFEITHAVGLAGKVSFFSFDAAETFPVTMKEFTELSPSDQQDLVPMLVVGLYKTTTKQQLSWILYTFGGGARAVNIEKHRQWNYHCSIPRSHAASVVQALKFTTVLVEERGVWVAQSPEQTTLLSEYILAFNTKALTGSNLREFIPSGPNGTLIIRYNEKAVRHQLAER